MKVGDKRQAVILSVVAVGAIVFLILQLMPQGKKIAAALTSSAGTTSEKVTTIRGDLPSMLQTDPFSHPYLAALSTKSSKPDGNGEGVAAPLTQRPPGGILSPAQVEFEPGSSSPVFPNVKPGEITGNSQQPIADVHVISVSAVVRATSSIAILTCDGKETSVKVGDTIVNGIRVKSLDDSGVTLETASRTVRIRVGHEVKL